MVTIIIPTYNEEKFLPRLLKDIQRQTLHPDTIIVADAFSKDRTRAIAKKFGCTVIDGGLPGVGRNRGASAVKSGIILFLDADMRLHATKFLEKNLKEFSDRKLDIATVSILPDKGSYIDTLIYQTFNMLIRLTAHTKPHAQGGCIIIRKKIHDTIGGFDERIKIAEDMDYTQRAAKKGRFGILNAEPIATSMRRFARDGYSKTLLKYALTELHMATLGNVTTNIINYQFGYDTRKKKRIKTVLQKMFGIKKST